MTTTKRLVQRKLLTGSCEMLTIVKCKNCNTENEENEIEVYYIFPYNTNLPTDL